MHRYREAINYFNKAVELNSYDGNAYYNRGVAYNNIGNKEEACMNFKRGSELNQNDAAMQFQILCQGVKLKELR
jgi:Flp pilus assembly protein TadD